METHERTMRLRIYTDENAHVGDLRLVDELVRRAR
jgi:PII-like signaling protein